MSYLIILVMYRLMINLYSPIFCGASECLINKWMIGALGF